MKIMIKNLTFSFDGRLPFFKPISLELPAQRLFFITGANGIGKSTFFKALQGATFGQEKVKGAVIISGTDYSYENDADKQALAPIIKNVAQDYRSMLAPDFTVRQQLQAAQLIEHPGLQSLPEKFVDTDLLDSFAIALDQKASSLSGGQAQIVAILMIVQQNPKILLLDEPTAALDYKNSRLLMRFLEALIKKDELLVLMICHDKELMEEVEAKRIAITLDEHESRIVVLE